MTVSTPKTTETPADTGAGAAANRKAAEGVAPGPRKGAISGQDNAEPAPVKTDVAEPVAPKPTSNRPAHDDGRDRQAR